MAEKGDEKENVAEFFLEGGGLAIDGLLAGDDGFECFFSQIGQDRAQALLFVPGASLGSAQGLDDDDELCHAVGGSPCAFGEEGDGDRQLAFELV